MDQHLLHIGGPILITKDIRFPQQFAQQRLTQNKLDIQQAWGAQLRHCDERPQKEGPNHTGLAYQGGKDM